ncbi:MAG: hypothetical protein AB1765_13480 [Candidatus Hydrogenedentota bacterium]
MQLIYFDNAKKKGIPQSLSVMFNGETYNFPLNIEVDNIDSHIVKGLIGNWEKPTDWEKDILLGVTTKDCPRNKLYTIVDNRMVNLFETIEIKKEDKEVVSDIVKEQNTTKK